MRPRNLILILFSLLAGLTARAFDPEKDVRVSFEKGAVVLRIPDGAHLKMQFTAVTLKEPKIGALKVGPMPARHDVDELGDGIWRRQVAIPVKGENLKDPVTLDVEYQPCTEGEGGVCFPPTGQALKVKASDIPAAAKVDKPAEADPGTAGVQSTAGKVAAASPETPLPQTTRSTSSPSAPASPSEPAAPKGGFLWSYVMSFLWGIVASLTPCVYPMITITLAIIGAKGAGKTRSLALSLMLVLGMAVTYTAMGVLAGLGGSVFGAFAQKPAFLIPMALVFGLFALSLFGAFEINLPASWQAKLQGDGPRRGFLGAFVSGLVLGPISAPCVGPVAGTLLAEITKQGSAVYGASQLFVFALGMGLLFVVAGVSTSVLPRSGDWLVRTKQVMGLVVLGFAVWTVRLLVPEWANFALWAVVALAAAPVFGAFRAAEDLGAGFMRAIGFLALALGVLLGVRAVERGLAVDLLPRGGAAEAKTESWRTLWIEQDFEKALAKAKAENRLLLVDTYAEWCAQCKELDEKTWPDAAVQQWIRTKAVAVRIDLDKVRPDLQKKLGVQGYPTVLVLDGEGRELRRSLGFQKAEGMLAFLEGR